MHSRADFLVRKKKKKKKKTGKYYSTNNVLRCLSLVCHMAILGPLKLTLTDYLKGHFRDFIHEDQFIYQQTYQSVHENCIIYNYVIINYIILQL